jgi:NADH:ubiquinone oxidoreductase subunit 2 (subunit N)
VSRARIRRLVALSAVTLAGLLVLAPAALAADGVGLWGRTDDKVITFFAFGVMAFFAVLVIVLSLIQNRLETRKERIHRELERLRPPAAE